MSHMNRRRFLTAVSLIPLMSNELLANSNDIYLSPSEFRTIETLNKRLNRVKKFVGFANFNLISYVDVLTYARNYPRIGAFTNEELILIDRLFYENPNGYGFYGKKTCNDIENIVKENEVTKIEHTGHYLFKGKPQKDYASIRDDVGTTLILTSGVRNVVKQLSLYVNKIYNTGGNMTKATLSIAPPAYSYHTVSDFDVGRVDWGYKNFTPDFASTNEFKKMQKLKYIGMRYNKENKDGVRFEPWHVEVI